MGPFIHIDPRVNGTVAISFKPGPSTVLTKDEEECLVKYIIEMSDRGFGLNREDIMRLAFTIAEQSGRSHPFHDGMAGRGWLDAFRITIPKFLYEVLKHSHFVGLPWQVKVQ